MLNKMIRKCPVCCSSIGPWQLFKPGFLKSAGLVICGNCKSVISEPWSKYSWFGFLGYGLTGLLLRLIPREAIGIKNEFYYYVSIFIIAAVIFLFPLYYYFPLQTKNEKSDF